MSKYDNTTGEAYEEEQGELAKVGTLAHEAAKVWYRGYHHTDPTTGFATIKGEQSDMVQVATIDQAFKTAIVLCHAQKDYSGNPNSQVPNSPAMIEEARTLFEQITAYYPRDKVRVVFVERAYKGTLPNGVNVSLIIDLGLDLGEGRLGIVDYKTGYITMNDDEMKEEDQVLMNLLAVSRDPELAAFPRKQFQYFWVRDGWQSKPFAMDEQRLADYEMWLALEWDSILKDENPKEEINRFCPSCGRRDVCTKYALFLGEAYGGINLPEPTKLTSELIQLGLPEDRAPAAAEHLIKSYTTVKEWTPEDIAALTEDELMARFDRIGSQFKLMEKNKKKMQDVLKGSMERVNAKEMEGVKLRATKIASVQTKFDDKIVMEMCKQYNVSILDLFSCSAGEVKSKFAQWPDAITHLNNTSMKFPTQAWVKIAALKPKQVASKRGKKAEKVQLTDAATTAVVAISSVVDQPADQF